MIVHLGGVTSLILGADGEVAKRLHVTETIDGSPAGMIAVIDFDSADAMRSIFSSDEYQALMPVRERGFSAMNMYVAQSM